MPPPGEQQRRRRRATLRARLTVAFAVAMAAVLACLGAFLYLRLGAELLDGTDRTLRSRMDDALSALDRPRRPAIAGRPALVDPDESFAQILDRSGAILDSSSAVASAPMLPSHAAGSLSGPTIVTRRVAGVDEPARLLAAPANVGGRPAVVVLGATLGDRNDALRQLLALYAVAGPAALALSSLAGWTLAGAALRPVERMRRRAAEISHADPHARLPVPDTGDELNRLATTLNGLLARLQDALEREHRFVDDASHELRTPLAILKAELDLAVSRPRTAAELATTVRTAARETDRLVQLAQDLLVLARTGDGQLPLHRVAVDLPTLVEQAVAGFRIRARETGVHLEVCAAPETVRVDPARVRQALENLVENALRHGRGPITVTAAPDDGRLRIEVHDRGPGFPESFLPAAFTPFTRGPTPRPGTTPEDGHPGAGLGLAIVKAIAEAHGGTARAVNDPTGGARVRVDLGGG